MITGTDDAIISVNTWLSDPNWFVAPRPIWNVPLPIGAPQIRFVRSKFKPVGSPLTLSAAGSVVTIV